MQMNLSNILTSHKMVIILKIFFIELLLTHGIEMNESLSVW
jgi:hypothetical protein